MYFELKMTFICAKSKIPVAFNLTIYKKKMRHNRISFVYYPEPKLVTVVVAILWKKGEKKKAENSHL